MDRIIEVKVGGNYITKDSKNAGVRGEANVTVMRIAFDEGWDGYAKSITFWDAHGANPVKITLTTNLLENILDNTRVYLVPIPSEPMAEAGTMTFVIDGYIEVENEQGIEKKRQKTVADTLEVKDSPDTKNAGTPTDPTPTEIEQLHKAIDSIENEIVEGYLKDNRTFCEDEECTIAVDRVEGKLYIDKKSGIIYRYHPIVVTDEYGTTADIGMYIGLKADINTDDFATTEEVEEALKSKADTEDVENKVSKDGDTVNGNLTVNGTLRGKYIYIGSADEDDIHLDTYRTVGELVNKVLYFENSTDAEIELDIILRNVATPRQDNDATNKKYVDSVAEKNTIVTIKRNGTALTPDSNRAVDITVPTKVSQLTNDRNYIQRGSWPELDGIFLWTEMSFDDGDYGIASIMGFYSYDDEGRGIELYGYNEDTYEEYAPIIRGVGTPIADNDVATKAYVDSMSGGGSEGAPMSEIWIDSYIEEHGEPDPVRLTGGWGDDSDSYVLNLIGRDDIDMSGEGSVIMRGVGSPVAYNDATNKGYVDNAIASAITTALSTAV